MIIAIDFDNTIFEMPNYPYVGSVKLDAVDTINSWYDSGHTIIIFTARSKFQDVREAKKALKNAGIKYHKFNKNETVNRNLPKIYADVYIDDKGLRFEDNWSTLKNLY